MASFNKIIIMGNLTRDPELTFLPSQTPVVEFGLASNRKYKGSDGQMKEDTCFIDCRCYGVRAETINKYCKRGSQLLVEGRLQFDRWEAQDGSKRSRHRVFVENFQFTSSGPSGQGGQGQSYDSSGSGPGPTDDFGGGSNDDIPF
ncbi:MAG: single-stranded DNA-binding protein [Phycisphaerae bacterium]|nr:single-stranded DNA-binding protein [Phycisphaerae bacterium]